MAEVFDNELDDYLSEFDKEESCAFCGESSENKFCSKECEKAYFND